MRNLFLLVLFFIFLTGCHKKTPEAKIQYEKLEHIVNQGGYDLYNLYITSNINLDSLGRAERRNFFLFCPLDGTADFTMETMDEIKYKIRGHIEHDSTQSTKKMNRYTAKSISFEENINNSRSRELEKHEIKKLVEGKECIPCKLYNGGYFFKPAYYSEPFCIPVKDILKVLDDTLDRK